MVFGKGRDQPCTYIEEEDDPVDAKASIDVEPDAVERHGNGGNDHARLQANQVDQRPGSDGNDARRRVV